MTSGVLRISFLLPVLLTLSVSSALAQGSSTTRVEQDDPGIVYSGNWYSNESAGHSGGMATLTNAKGARAAITFTGSSITWIGVMDGWSGLATVYLDGTLKEVDTYGQGGYQQVVYAARGLSSGPHTLSIEVTHERDAKTDGSWVWIDAFDIENGATVPGGITATTGRIEENNPALIFTGRWYSNASEALSGGGAVLATDAGSRATINFNGTGIGWLSNRDEWSGIARVYLDGELKTTIDNYLSPSQARVVPYTIGGLPLATHTLTIEATGTRNESAKGSWVWLDAFDVVR